MLGHATVALHTGLHTACGGLCRAMDKDGPEASESHAAWDAYAAGLASGMRSGFTPAFRSGWRQAMRARRVKAPPDDVLEISAAEDWAATNAASMAQGLTSVQRGTVRTAVARGIARGEPPAAIARSIRDAVGLDDRAVRSVEALRRELAQRNVPPERAAVRVERRRDALIRERAETIARTEVIAARNEGLLRGWRHLAQSGEIPLGARKIWVAGGVNTCPLCLTLVSTGPVPLDVPFPGGALRPPLHPRCRCTLALADNP